MWRQGCNGDGVVIRDVYVIHDPVDLTCADDGMTRQEFKDECDINVLLAHYERTGQFFHLNGGTPQYLDVSEVPDFAGALAIVEKAREAFMQLPAKARAEFDNDPGKFVAYAEDPANLPRMREWGLAPPAAPVGELSPEGGVVPSPPPSNAPASS